MFKYIIAALLVTGSFANTQDFITGFLIGSGIILKVPHAWPCAVTAPTTEQNIRHGVELITQGGVENVVLGVQEITHALDQVSQDCGGALIDVAHLFSEVKSIVLAPGFPHQALTNLYTNAELVGRDVAEVVKAALDKDSINEGLKLGDIVRITIWG
ncbi:hypothetical protein pb186bvf_004189 [Paramecium bursaria]